LSGNPDRPRGGHAAEGRATTPARPLVVTSDGELLDEVLRLAAAAGVEAEVAPDMRVVGSAWNTAPLVLLDAAAVRASSATNLARRPGVLLLGGDPHVFAVWERAVAVGAEEVLVLPHDEARLVDRLSDTAEQRGREALLVGVLGGRGGAGASTLAAALAVSACRRRLKGVLIDGDPLGGGIDMLVGGEDVGGLRWPDLADAQGRVASDVLRQALPRVEELLVLSWDRGDLLTITPDAMQSVLAAAQRGSDLVVVDLPRRLDPAAEVALSSVDIALLVVPAEVRGAASAARVSAAASLLTRDLRLVVRGPSLSALPADVIADALGLPLAGELQAEPALAVAAERGEAPGRRARGPLSAFCDGFLDDIFSSHPAAA
jgi:secretion/DNA translocation related CpaE-like protein